HHLIDFGDTLGSDSQFPKRAWQGHTYTLDFRWGLMEMATLGLYSADWERMSYRFLPSVGKYEAATFEPEEWKPSYPNPAFMNRTAADCFWAAKQVAAFTDEQIRAIVGAGQYSNPKAAEAISETIILRRDKIRRTY